MREKGSRYMVLVLVVACVAGLGLTPQQEVLRLEQRINQLEQRLYGMETSLRSVEQQSRLGSTTSRGLNQQEVALLVSQLQTLQLRLADYECALAKLDERTLSPAMREARRKSAGSDACRLNAETPLRLPERRP